MHCRNSYLIEIVREGLGWCRRFLRENPARPDDRLVCRHRLILVLDLRRMRGLQDRQPSRSFKPAVRHNRVVSIEAVVSPSHRASTRTIRESPFSQSRYNGGAVIAVSRRGERVHRKLGDIVRCRPKAIRALLIEANCPPSSHRHHRYARDLSAGQCCR